MKQYNQIKAKHPQALLLFRVGDFYETFGEDAVQAARILGIVLTSRRNGSSDIELAGFPHHSLENYLPKLVRAGMRVAICDQLEDPKMTKTIVKRGVTELVTPGISFSDNVLEQKSNHFLCAIHFEKDVHGISFLDASTGEFLVDEGPLTHLEKLLQAYPPKEIVFQKQKKSQAEWLQSLSTHLFKLEDWVFTTDYTNDLLLKQFQTNSLKGFGVQDLPVGAIAAGAILHYLAETEHHQLDHIVRIERIPRDQHVWLDRFTLKNLELIQPANEGGVALLHLLDRTFTPMGGRLLKRWVAMPLKNLDEIHKRLNAVASLVENQDFRDRLSEILKPINDLDRLISKAAVGRLNPKEMRQLMRTMRQIQPLRSLIEQEKHWSKYAQALQPCPELIDQIQEQLHEDPALAIGKGAVIAYGVNAELDELRNIAGNGKAYLEELQERESARTGISSLKVAFNNVFGFYIEVRNTHKDKVPADWIRKQTLVSAERYITEELKEYEAKILGAEDKIYALESELYQKLVASIVPYVEKIQQTSSGVAQIDGLLSFALTSIERQFNYPQVDESKVIDIENGRHPIIENQLKEGELYVPNSIYLDEEEQQIIMITGPNMSGKSAILRQTAVIALLAQMGCFVPAEKARIGLLDRVFTRVGASDNLATGESTFMVEMNETSSILNNLSDRSLILLDEIGRGTSTYDGISIAWAIAEYLHEFPKARAKTLFATHYHELNEMSAQFPRIQNYNVAVKEMDEKILFLRKLVKGGSEHSFGIHVAELAGMPAPVVARAKTILKKLEESHDLNGGKPSSKVEREVLASKDMQLSFFQLNDPVLENIREELESIEINTLTPVEALMKLNDIKKLIGG